MRRTTILMLSAGALALSACGQKSDASAVDNNSMMTNSAMASTDMGNDMAPAASAGQMFANAAASSDAFEIASSQLAATNGKSDAVKAFATKMIAAHTDSTAKLKTTAAGLSPAIIPDPTLTADQQKTLDDLKGKMGADFDTAYAAAQVDAHQKTLDKLKDYSANGDVPQLKSFATDLVPIVSDHLKMAKDLK